MKYPGRGGGERVQSSRGGELRAIEKVTRRCSRTERWGGGARRAPLDLEKVGGSVMRVTDSCHFFFTPTRGGVCRGGGGLSSDQLLVPVPWVGDGKW